MVKYDPILGKLVTKTTIDGVNYTAAEINEGIRKSIAPYSYTSYLPDGTPYTTPLITLNVPTKLLIPTTIKSSLGWQVADVGGGNFAVQYSGESTETFKIFMSSSMTTSSNNTVVEIFMYKNGIVEEGVSIARKVGTGADVGALAVLGEFSASKNDYIEVYVKVSLSTSITFDKTSIIITEKN